MTKNKRHITCNIAKSGEVLNWGGLSPFQLRLGLIENLSQSASCHIANRYAQFIRKHKAEILKQLSISPSSKALIFKSFMTKIISEKVEANSIAKMLRLTKLIAIGLMLFSILLLFIQTEITRLGWWFDRILMLLFGFYIYFKSSKDLKNKSGQFIEWKQNNIHYKLKEDKSSRTIDIKDIKDIQINLDSIYVTDLKNQTLKLDISDFREYKKRQRIKENFEKINKLVHNK